MPRKTSGTRAAQEIMRSGDVERAIAILQGQGDAELGAVRLGKRAAQTLESWVFDNASFDQLSYLYSDTNILDWRRGVCDQIARVATPQQAGELVADLVAGAIPMRDGEAEQVIALLRAAMTRERAYARAIASALVEAMVYPGTPNEQQLTRLLKKVIQKGA